MAPIFSQIFVILVKILVSQIYLRNYLLKKWRHLSEVQLPIKARKAVHFAVQRQNCNLYSHQNMLKCNWQKHANKRNWSRSSLIGWSWQYWRVRVFPHRASASTLVLPLVLEHIVMLGNGSGIDFQASPWTSISYCCHRCHWRLVWVKH